MKHVQSLIANRKIRFGIVGIANTSLNFAVLNAVFFGLHQSKIVASVVATLCAVCVSFFLNRGFVFRQHARSWRQPLMFALVTLTGVLIVQNITYITFVYLLHDHTYAISQVLHSVTGLSLSDDFFDINISNLLASLIVMVWNYNGYRLLVFKPKQLETVEETNEEIILTT